MVAIGAGAALAAGGTVAIVSNSSSDDPSIQPQPGGWSAEGESDWWYAQFVGPLSFTVSDDSTTVNNLEFSYQYGQSGIWVPRPGYTTTSFGFGDITVPAGRECSTNNALTPATAHFASIPIINDEFFADDGIHTVEGIFTTQTEASVQVFWDRSEPGGCTNTGAPDYWQHRYAPSP
jgi:hypothetical protein